MPDIVEIGFGRSARRGYHLAEIALVAAPSDAVASPATVVEIERLGGLGVLDGEGLWTRYADAEDRLAALGADTAELQAVSAKPVSPDLLRQRIGELRDAEV